jgi:hypothetical protein
MKRAGRTATSPWTLRIHSTVFIPLDLRSVYTGTFPFALRGTAYARAAAAAGGADFVAGCGCASDAAAANERVRWQSARNDDARASMLQFPEKAENADGNSGLRWNRSGVVVKARRRMRDAVARAGGCCHSPAQDDHLAGPSGWILLPPLWVDADHDRAHSDVLSQIADTTLAGTITRSDAQTTGHKNQTAGGGV